MPGPYRRGRDESKPPPSVRPFFSDDKNRSDAARYRGPGADVMDGGARLPNDPGRHWNPRWFFSIGEIRTTKCAEPFFPGVPSTYSDDTTGTAARQVSG